jgi:protein NEDD1
MKKHILCGSNEEGSVCIWDTNTVNSSGNNKSIIANFSKQHNAPCTSISFSTVNHLLLSSAGLDKRIYFYDISDKRIVKSLSTDSPCTSISFNDDGVSIAVGTSHGNILLYDLRYITNSTHNLSNTLQMISAHSPLSVNYLSFQNSDKKVSFMFYKLKIIFYS